MPECWRVLEKPAQEDQSKALQAASALALYDPENPLWEKIRIDVANRLVAENAYVVAHWIDALRPVAKQLSDPLMAIFHDEKRAESERTLAASALAEYVSDQPDELAELLMDATEKQFAALYPSVEGRRIRPLRFLRSNWPKRPPSDNGEGTDRSGQQSMGQVLQAAGKRSGCIDPDGTNGEVMATAQAQS